MTLQRPRKLLFPRILLLLLVFMQYASVVHGAEHHLFDDPAASSLCDAVHLQQQLGEPAALNAASGLHLPGPPVQTPYAVSITLCLQATDNHTRGPPLASLN